MGLGRFEPSEILYTLCIESSGNLNWLPIVHGGVEKARHLYDRVRLIIRSARAGVERSVNSAQVAAYWLIGREIFEDEQNGKQRADYGRRVLRGLAVRLSSEFGKGFSHQNLKFFRQFFLLYPGFMPGTAIVNALRSQSPIGGPKPFKIGYAVRSQLAFDPSPTIEKILYAVRRESWKPGRMHLNLSWTHYRTLLRVENPSARSFYEIEAIQNNWSARELERQINSLLYERLAKSRDKAGLLRLAAKGQEIRRPGDVFKDPVVIEFLGMPESPRLVESKVEEALIGDLQRFLLELGKGFAFVARQERITLDGDHFYADLVFYHAVLKCYVLVDLKVGKLTHEDLGQMQLYANYFDRERRTAGDGPTLGLILCTDKNDAVVRYTLGEDQEKIFASRYRLHLPSEAELAAELKRELRART